MALSNRKITVYANPVANLPDHPSQTGFTAAQLKAAFDAIANEEVKTTINGIIDDVIATSDGASGADQVGATAITDLDGATVQAILESLRNKLKSTVDNASGADFIGATAISNLDGTTVQAILESIRNKLKSAVDGSSGADFIGATPLKAGGANTAQGLFEELNANIATVNTNEATRVAQEAARVIAEGARATSETSRANAETSRTNAESGRVTAENERVVAEQVRVEADILRGQTVEAIEQNYAPRLTSAEAQINNFKADNVKSLRSFGGVCDGITDDYNAIMLAHNTMNDGDILLIPEPTLFTTPVVWTKRINIVCLGNKGYFIPNVGVANDAITIRGGFLSTSINNMEFDLNIYGVANCCKNALVADFVSLSNIKARIKAGAVEYGYVEKGCLLTDRDIIISANYGVPFVGAVMPANHIYLDTSAVVVTDSNAGKFKVRLEGGGNGIVKTNANFIETVEFTGAMEGLAGKAFDINRGRYININNLHMENNAQDSVFTNCRNIEVGGGVRNNGMKFKFIDTRGITIDGYSGSLEFDENCTGEVKQIGFESTDIITNNSKGVFIDGTIANFSSAILHGVVGIGKNIPENLFHNPFIDIWSAGFTSAPDGWSSSTVAFSKETINYYPENPSKMAMYCQQTGVTINDGTRATLKATTTMNSKRWVSITLPVYVATGQPDLRIFIYDISQYRLVYTVTQKDQWVLVCGSALVDANQNIRVQVSPYNAGYVAGNYYIGGLTVVNGNIASKYLLDNGKRSEHIVDSVSNIPAFVGQRAYLSGTGKWYMAKGIVSSADWIILN